MWTKKAQPPPYNTLLFNGLPYSLYLQLLHNNTQTVYVYTLYYTFYLPVNMLNTSTQNTKSPYSKAAEAN